MNNLRPHSHGRGMNAWGTTMLSAVRKIISVITLITTLLVVVRQLKEAVESFKKEKPETKEA